MDYPHQTYHKRLVWDVARSWKMLFAVARKIWGKLPVGSQIAAQTQKNWVISPISPIQ